MTKEDKEIIDAISSLSLEEFKELISNVCKENTDEVCN